MLLNYKEAYKKFKNDYGINQNIKNKKLYKIIKGIYSDKKNIDLTAVYSKKYPNSIVTMDSAFYYYNLTDIIPEKIYLAISYHAYTIKNEDIVVNYIDEKIINEGKIEVLIDNEKVNMYNKERLLIELIRKRNQIPFDYYKEIILNYRKIANDLDMNKIEKYISMFKNEENIGNVIIREVF